jgi:hypothetical protein
MKFLQIIEQYSGQLTEQDQAGGSTVQPPDQVDEPAGIATMGNLLKKALTMKINDSDKYKISQLPEINEKNAAQVIDQLISIMKTYSVDIDIDGNNNTSL